MASGAELSEMDKAADEVRRTMRIALEWVADQEEGLFGTYLLSDVDKSLIGNIRANEQGAQRWLTEQRQWAERGKEPDGRSFPVAFYLSAGKIIADTFAAAVGETARQDVFRLAATATVRDVANVGARTVGAVANVAKGVEDAAKAVAAPWPMWVKLLGGAGGVVLAAVVAKQLLDKVPDVSGLIGGKP